MNGERHLSMWTVFDHPSDFPNNYVARQCVVLPGGETRITDNIIICPSLDMIREQLVHMGLTPISRSEGDHPKIVEVWL